MKMKRILAFILTALMLISAFGCDKQGEGEITTEAPETTTEAPEVTEVEFLKDGVSEYAYVYAKDGISDALEDYVLSFRLSLRRMYKASDFLIDKNGNEAGEKDKKEILIGDTGREASKALATAVPDGCFGIEVTASKVAIYAKEERVLKRAFDYFVENYLSGGEAKDVILPVGRYISEVQEFNVKSMISSKEGYSTTHEKLYDIPATDKNKIMQGGCTDGTYMYYCMVNSGSPQLAYVYKYSIAENKLVGKSALLETDHSNDMTYNSKTNELIVLHNSPRNAMLTILDPDTLKVKSTRMVSFNMFCIDYQPERDVYVIGISGGQNFSVLDANFQVDRDYIPLGSTRFEAQSTGYTTQGVACDEDYIYFVQYKKNVIMVYDWSGKFVNQIPLSIPSNTEPENISIVGDTFYIACNNSSWTGGEAYEVKLVLPEA